MSSGLAPLVTGAMQIMSPGVETALNLKSHQRKNILRNLFYSFYQGHCPNPVIFDTSRSWTARMPLIQTLFPQSKVICCVRDISWVVDSLERQVRKNPCHFTRLFGPQTQGNVYTRSEALVQSTGLVGASWSSLKEAFYGDQAESLLVVDYELLARAPEKVLRLLYEFIGQPWYPDHNYDQVEFDEPDFDEALGLEGLHKVRPKVEFIPQRTILPPDLFQRFQDMDFWVSVKGSKAHVIHKK